MRPRESTMPNESLPIVSSLGGPRVLIPSDSIGRWRGADGSHYDSACSVEDWTGVIIPWGEPLVVLGVEPNDIYVMQRPNGALFIEWVAADNLGQLVELAIETEQQQSVEESREIGLGQRQYSLIDAVLPGNDPGLVANIAVEPGRYLLSTAIGKSSRTSTVIHKLQFLTGSG